MVDGVHAAAQLRLLTLQLLDRHVHRLRDQAALADAALWNETSVVKLLLHFLKTLRIFKKVTILNGFGLNSARAELWFYNLTEKNIVQNFTSTCNTQPTDQTIR